MADPIRLGSYLASFADDGEHACMIFLRNDADGTLTACAELFGDVARALHAQLLDIRHLRHIGARCDDRTQVALARVAELEAERDELRNMLARQPCSRRNDPFPPRNSEDCICVTCVARRALASQEDNDG
jgi:hypothetical protein